jgi:hypothetical protein
MIQRHARPGAIAELPGPRPSHRSASSTHQPDPDRLRKPLHGALTAVFEAESLAAYQLAEDPGYEDLAAERTRRDPRRQDDVAAEEVVAFGSQTFTFPNGYVANGTFTVISSTPQFANTQSQLWWTTANIWNNASNDDAALFNCLGQQVDFFDDGS